ncbi:hypothetical protein GmHk_12G034482 [Glycine max]|nr:hypothetical protein GmHk_12G034482 [Glycine max]
MPIRVPNSCDFANLKTRIHNTLQLTDKQFLDEIHYRHSFTHTGCTIDELKDLIKQVAPKGIPPHGIHESQTLTSVLEKPISSLSQTGLRFRDCSHIVEIVFVEIVSATYRLRSNKTRKGKSPGKGTPRAFLLFLLLPEFVFVANWVALPSKKTRKKSSPGKGGTRFWKSIVLGLKTPREAIEGMSLLYVNDENPLFNGLSLL